MTTETQASDPAPQAWHPVSERLQYLTRCSDGTTFLNCVKLPAHAVEWAIPAPEGGEREAFEEFYGPRWGKSYLEWRDDLGRYAWDAAQEAWRIWQARAALAAPAPQAPITTVMGLAVYDTPAPQAALQAPAPVHQPLTKPVIEQEFARICKLIPERRSLVGIDSFIDGVRFAERAMTQSSAVAHAAPESIRCPSSST